MPLPQWPAGIPYEPDNDAISIDPHQPAAVTQVEDGPDIMRVQSNTIIQKISYKLQPFTIQQMATWRTFIETTCVQGTAQFEMQVFGVAATCVSRRVYLDGGKWMAQREGARWRVSFTLCVFPTV